jgi:hypothetical protein
MSLILRIRSYDGRIRRIKVWPYFIIQNSAFIIALLLEMPIVVAGVGLSA